MREFKIWFEELIDSISDYKYYVDFDKICRNVDKIKIELNILNSLIGSKNIESDFINLLKDYPEILKCIPILLAVRSNEIAITTEKENIIFDFKKQNLSTEEYSEFMDKTGLFDMIKNKKINNFVDYVTGIETGLDSNARKNRGGHLMENLVETYIVQSGFVKGESYFKEMYLKDIERFWNIDLSSISNMGKTAKRFDFVIKTESTIYAIETNFYSSGGSKLNETARSYKNIAIEAEGILGFEFIWITDGKGWQTARNNLEETFDSMTNLYNINDLRNGIFEKVIK
ncbi:type II restriction endonuclease [Ezakiella coagulans]|uniref:type II restriction endonuclease n=1 Tax=Ezakiella coagulans TaxID=46507 RepID=UPI002014C29C|nr:type II restriction endonuclease [Ezakiella coagulans]UQK61586.1 type II restriction endonuclease [Ezakiella coagulans]